MIPVSAGRVEKHVPLVTFTLIVLNIIIYLWDRQGHLFGNSVTFSDLTMRPHEVVLAVKEHTNLFPITTLFTSLFLHGSIVHIAGNMIFLLVFGTTVEFALGAYRFAGWYLIWGVVAALTQIVVDPSSQIPTLGASGAIGGVLGCYLLLFPGSKIEILVPLLAFTSYKVSAWILLGVWFLYQLFWPQQGVANWAHVGGFLAGMLTVLLMGGRGAILRGREQQLGDQMYT